MEYTEYQKKTIQRIVNNYMKNDNSCNRMLVADEVGLGKTIVAKGVVRCLLYNKYLESKGTLNEYNVMYLCSNLNIAEQNQRKLGIKSLDNEKSRTDLILSSDKDYDNTKNTFEQNKRTKENKTAENRITMLLVKYLHEREYISVSDLRAEYEKVYGATEEEHITEDGNKKIFLKVLPITTRTSIKIERAGCETEREFIQVMLWVMEKAGINQKDHKIEGCTEYKALIEKPKKIENDDKYEDKLEKYEENIKTIKEDFQPKFEDKFNEIYTLNKDELLCIQYSKLSDYLDHEKKETLGLVGDVKEDELSPEIKKKIVKIEDTWKCAWEKMRKVFALATLEWLHYDLVIMDEFQNFSDILMSVNALKYERQPIVDCLETFYRIIESIQVKSSEEEFKPHKTVLDFLEQKYAFKETVQRNLDILPEVLNDTEGWKEAFGKKKNLFDSFDKTDASKKDTVVLECFRKVAYEYLSLPKRIAPISEETKKTLEYVNKEKAFQWAMGLYNGDREVLETLYQEIADKEINLDNYKLSVEYKRQGSEQVETLDFEQQSEELKKQVNLLNSKYLFGWWSSVKTFEKIYRDIKGMYNTYEKYRVTPLDYFFAMHVRAKKKGTYRPLVFNTVIQLLMREDTIVAGKQLAKYLWEYYYVLLALDKEETNLELSVGNTEVQRLFIYKMNSGNVSADDLENCENIILEHIFRNEYNDQKGMLNMLMLSATPFRMYLSADAETISDEDTEQTDVSTVCDFLDHQGKLKLTQSLTGYKKELERYAISPSANIQAVLDKKEEFQKNMCNVFSRMERSAVIRELDDEWFKHAHQNTKDEEIGCGGIIPFYQYIEEIRDYGLKKQESELEYNTKSIIKYAENAPYLFSFMNVETKEKEGKNDVIGYLMKSSFDAQINAGRINAMKEHAKSYILYDDYQSKYENLGCWHGVYFETLKCILDLDTVVEHLEENFDKEEVWQNHPGAARMLWIPTTTRKREGRNGGKTNGVQNPFDVHRNFGKTILFSRYVMVPRMIAGLTSYEAERRLIWLICRNREMEYNKENVLEILAKVDEIESNKESIIRELTQKPEKGKENIYSICQNAIEEYFKALISKNDNLYQMCENKKKRISEWITEPLAENLLKKIFLNEPIGMLAVWATEGMPESETEHTSKIIDYCEHGDLKSVLLEWFYLCLENEEELGEFLGMGIEQDNALHYIKSTYLDVDLYRKEKGFITPCQKQFGGGNNNGKLCNYYARCVGTNKDDDKLSAISNLQKAFNSPFAPFVFATTSLGQEGLDFHYYADQIVHWDLPANPVDFEQREGRINRHNCLAIRKKLIEWYGTDDAQNVFEEYKKAKDSVRETLYLKPNVGEKVKCGMIPNWILPCPEDKQAGCATIKRVVPYFLNSEMMERYHNNLKVLQLYRSVIGQSNPEEIMERLMEKRSADEVKELFVDFSPYNDKLQ